MPKLKIKKIRVRNFGSFVEGSLDFEGLKYPVLVLGDNGAGKTVFFVDSITYAFFGDAYGIGNISKKVVSRMHGGGDIEVVVTLESSDGMLLEVRNKKVYRVDPKKEYPNINFLTGHNYDTLLATYIVRQGKVANFFEIRPSERRDYLIKLLKYRFDKVRDHVKNELDRVKNEISSVENRLSEIEGRFKSIGLEEVSQESLSKALEIENAKKKEFENRLRSLKSRLESLAKKRDELKDRRRSLQTLLEKVEKYRKVLNELNDVRRRISEFHRDPDTLQDSLLDELKTYIEKAIDALNKMDSLKGFTQDIEEQLKNYSKLLAEGDVSILPNLRKNLEGLREKKGRIDSEIKIYKERMEKLSKAVSNCPLCGSPLDEEHRNKILSEAEEKIRELESKKMDVNNEIRSMEEKIRGLEKLEQSIREVMGKIIKILEDVSKDFALELPSINEENIVEISNEFLGRVRNEYKRLGREFNGFLNRISKLGFRIDGLTSMIEGKPVAEAREVFNDYLKKVERLFREFGEHRVKVQSYEEEVGGLDEEEIKMELSELNDKIDALEKEHRSLQDEYGRVSKDVGEVEARIKNLEDLRIYLKRYDEYKESLVELDAYKKLHEDLDEIFKDGGFPTYLINEVIIPRLNDYMNHYLEEFNTNFRVRFEVKGTTIDAKIYEGDRERYLNSLSGGEMTLIGLAFRLAFGKLIAQLGMNYVFDFIILDEALTHLDDRNKKVVAEKLVRMVEDGVISQVIIITHDRTIQDLPFMEGTVVRIEKPAAVSKIVLAEREDI